MLVHHILGQQIRYILQDLCTHILYQFFPGVLCLGPDHLLQEFSGLHCRNRAVHLLNVRAEQPLGPDVNVHFLLRILHHDRVLGTPFQIIHIRGI